VRSLRLVAVAALAAGAAALPTAGASAAVLHPTKRLVTPVVKVNMTSGTRVQMAMLVDQDGGTSLDVDLSRATKGYALMEDHDWTFDMKPSSLTYSHGKGVFVTGRDLAHYGGIKLTFTKVSQYSTSCRNDNNAPTKVTHVKVAIKGLVHFRARSSASLRSKWGAVMKGTRSSQYYFARQLGRYVFSTNGECGGTEVPMPTGDPHCINGTLWSGPIAGMSSVRFVLGMAADGVPSTVQGVRIAMLASPSGAMRFDGVAASAPAPVVDTSAGNPVVSVATTAGTAATGSATLTAKDAGTPEPAQPCTDGTSSLTENITDYDLAGYTNGDPPLSIASMVGPAIVLPNSTTGDAAFTLFSYA